MTRTPKNIWLFRAYVTNKQYEDGEHFFEKTFTDHGEMKDFSAEHSVSEKKLFPEYVSDYWKYDLSE